MTQAIEVARSYLEAFYSDDRPRALALLSPDFDFAGPFSAVVGAEEFLASARRLLDAAEGTEIVHQWEDGDETCVVHVVSVAGHRVTMADWITVSRGRVSRERVYFDPQPLAIALSSRPAVKDEPLAAATIAVRAMSVRKPG